MRHVLMALGWLWIAGLGCGSSVGHGGKDVGAACTAANASTDCYSLCVTGSAHFPDRNFCSHACSSDGDCPSGSVCIAAIKLTNGSHVCAVTCKTNSDCGGFGAAYVCDAVADNGTMSPVNICWVP
jgi:hypothetical protein